MHFNLFKSSRSRFMKNFDLFNSFMLKFCFINNQNNKNTFLFKFFSTDTDICFIFDISIMSAFNVYLLKI